MEHPESEQLKQDKLARYAKAMGHPVRLYVLKVLSRDRKSVV